MEPVSAIVTAVALGAAAGLQTTATEAVKDGYAALKRYLLRKVPNAAESVSQLEKAPESKARRAVVEEDLAREGADTDESLQALANALLDALERDGPAAGIVGVTLAELKAAALRIADVRSAGTGVNVTKADIAGDIDIRGVRAGLGQGTSMKKASDPNV